MPLTSHLEQLPHEKIADHLMYFGFSLHVTRTFWHKANNELIYMISQLACPTLFFTLSATNTKWPNLHAIVPDALPHDATKQQQWRNQNIISNLHLPLLYMLPRFTIFREEALEKHLHVKDYSYKFVLLQFYELLGTPKFLHTTIF